jgi:hypothetical protein
MCLQCRFFRLAGLTESGGTITEGISDVSPLNPCQLFFRSFDHDHLALEEISIPLLVKLAILESMGKEAYTHMVGMVVGWWLDVE